VAAFGPVILALQLWAIDIATVGGAILLIRIAIKVGFWWRRSVR